jgi:3-oxoacyl-[acyl-carrier protein] reductase
MNLEGRVAMVTGGTRGIGKGISLAMAKAGADIAAVYRRGDETARETIGEIEALSRKAVAFKVDVTDSESVKEAVKQAVATFGKIDILVNNAGIASRGKSVHDTDIAELKRVIETHVFGSYYFSQAVLPTMRQQPRGDIIFISSEAAGSLRANGAPYNMSKAAMEALAMTLAKEEMPHGIRVNVIRPGIVDTEMGERVVKATLGVKDIKEVYAMFPFGRVGLVSDIGNMAAFLCTKEAEYITAAVIQINGGGA